MSCVCVIHTDSAEKWREILERSYQYDFYHTRDYHRLAEKRGEGEAFLFVYQEEGYFLALPMLLRPINSVQGLEMTDYYDVTSVYGYPGPVASTPYLPDFVVRGFQKSLIEFFSQQNVVSVFSRLHPLIPHQKLWLDGLGEIIEKGKTVSIDLSLPVDVQRMLYRKNHKYDINKLQRLGVNCYQDKEGRHVKEFIEIYYENMRRVAAGAAYFFEDDYFLTLMGANDFKTCLFICELSGEIICGGLFTLCDGLVQYHLGATRTNFLELAPMKLVFDTVRLWASQQNAKFFHLGGGVGGHEDSLFHFKAGFSKSRHPFYLWRWAVNPTVYNELNEIKRDWNERNGLVWESVDFFPLYRAPVISSSLKRES
jgi:hypothetical protein